MDLAQLLWLSFFSPDVYVTPRVTLWCHQREEGWERGATLLVLPVKPNTVHLGCALQVPIKEEIESLQVNTLYGQFCPR